MIRRGSVGFPLVGVVLVAGAGLVPSADPPAEPPRPAFDPAALRGALAARHPWAELARGMADRKDPGYGDYGQWSYLMWEATGAARHARAAAARGLAKLRTVGDTDKSRNTTRENTTLLARMYGGLRPALTADEDAAWRAELTRWADLIVGRGPLPWGTRTTDSDETTGHYFGLALIDKYLGTDYLGGAWKDGNTGDPVPVGRMREAVRGFVELARGGDWVESGWEYNQGTLQLLFCGALWAGADGYPEVAALAPEVADHLMWTLAPDRASHAGWGDCEGGTRRTLVRHAWVSLLGVLAGGYADALGPDRTANVRRLVRELTKGVAPTAYPQGYWYTLYRPFLCGFDPRPAAADRGAYVAPGPGVRATAVGSAVHRGPDHLLHVFSPAPVGVDHECRSVGEVRLRVGGVDVLDCLLGYGADGVDGATKNAPLAYGLSTLAARGLTSAEPTPGGGCRVVCRAEGRPAGGTYLPPPPVGSVERVVEGSADGRRLAVTDAFDLKPPRRPGREPGTAIYLYGGGPAVAAALDDPAGVRAAQTLWWVRGPYTLTDKDGAATLTYHAKGVPVTITVSGHQRTAADRAEDLIPEAGRWQFAKGELEGATRVRFVSADRRAVIRSVVVVGEKVGPGGR